MHQKKNMVHKNIMHTLNSKHRAPGNSSHHKSEPVKSLFGLLAIFD